MLTAGWFTRAYAAPALSGPFTYVTPALQLLSFAKPVEFEKPYTRFACKPAIIGDTYFTALLVRNVLLMSSLSNGCVEYCARKLLICSEPRMSCVELYWRPSVTAPQFAPLSPTHADRPNIRPPCPSAPFATLKPFSRRKFAFRPPPRSSVPIKPQRGPDSLPPVNCHSAWPFALFV